MTPANRATPPTTPALASGAATSVVVSDTSLTPPPDATRSYYGAEFCDELVPTPEEVVVIRAWAEERGMAFTLVTPPVVQSALGRVLDALEPLERGAEVVVNDWGVLRALHGRDLQLVAGRTFSKNKRDPRIETVFERLPAELQRQYRKLSVLQPATAQLLADFGVTRVEVDLPRWGADFPETLGADLRVSIHHPFAYVTTARRCPTFQAAGLGIRDGQTCPRPCADFSLQLINPGLQQPMRLVGNTYYVEVDIPDDVPPIVDRVVISPVPGALGGVRH